MDRVHGRCSVSDKPNVCVVDSSKVGRPITLVFQVMIKNERLALLQEDKQRFVNFPQVQQVYYVTFLLVMNVRDMAEFETFTRALFFASGNIKSFKTIVSLHNARQEMTVRIVTTN